MTHPTLPTYRLLCADDDAATRATLSTLLGACGYEVKFAGGIAEALNTAAAGHFDLFILDSCLCDGSGTDLCGRLRRLKPQTPVIFYSRLAQEQDREDGICAGAAAYVVKPEIQSLLAAVQSVLRWRDLTVAEA